MNELINLGNGQFVKVTMLKGERGTNIATITKTATAGLVDTYTVTLTDGSTTTFEVTNGKSIDYVEKTSTVGSVDTYTIYLTDGSTAGTFTVNNAIATIEQNFSTTSTNPLMNKTLTNVLAGVENGSTASKTYYANDLILRNDSLYEVTTTVAVGTAWADGVNITEKTLGELISELNNDLTANNKEFKADYQNSKYGFTVDGTFHPFSSGAVLIGTYSANTTIDVSAYGATSANQFLIVPNSLSGSPSFSRYTGATGDNISFSCSFSSGSKTLSNNNLNITAPTVSFSGTKKEGSANAFNIAGSAVCPYSVYFIGN